MIESVTPLDYTNGPLCSLGLRSTRVTGSVIGRQMQLAAVEHELDSARNGITCVMLEGEPGIGKTRILVAIEDLARSHGFIPIAITADEEIRGPFLLVRSIFACPAAVGAATSAETSEALARVQSALSNGDDPGLERLAPEQKLLRIFDLAALALRALAAETPIALLIDDLHWADEDSLRLLRYVVRVNMTAPILLVLATRPAETALLNEAVTLVADMERVGLLRRLKLGRLTQAESTEFLQEFLGGPVKLASAAVMHAQAEGVPFILAEQAQAYRETGIIQPIDGVWTLARNAERMVPSAVRTLIQRRAARLPENTRTTLAEAAVLGRSFSLRDLGEIRQRLPGGAPEAQSLEESLVPAVDMGLLIQQPDGSPADYTFTHEQIRQYAAETLVAPRRRAIHGAIVELLSGAGAPSEGSLPLLAQHALAAGQFDLCVRVSIEAARSALRGRAPDEALRLVEVAYPVASASHDRVELLRLRDDAIQFLRRTPQRLETLAELAALADALADSELEMEIMLRRAAALRLSDEPESASDLARRVRVRAAELQDLQIEMEACIELGQDLMRAELGEAFVVAASEVNLPGAVEALNAQPQSRRRSMTMRG